MAIAVRAEGVSKVYRLGIINHGMLYRDIQSWISRKMGKPDPHAKIGAREYIDTNERYWALKDVNFQIEQGERLGLIGRNGAGKSTLLKILSRITAPTEGNFYIKGRIASLLEVGTGFHPELSGRENVYLNGAILGMKRKEVARKFDEIVAFSEIEKFIDTPVKRYSSGMYVRLAFAVAAHLDSEILLADEVLAVGDQAFQKKCLGKMENVSKEQGRTIIFVSHNMGAVTALCNQGIFLEKGSIRYQGDIKNACSLYLNDATAGETTFPEGSLLEWASIRQQQDKLVVEARVSLRRPVDKPCLSVSISDYMGTPLGIANARNYQHEKVVGKEKCGYIRMVISEPKLHDGDYFFSVHYGDSRADYESFTHCLKLSVVGMAKTKVLNHPEYFGYVHPECELYEYQMPSNRD